MDRGDPAPQEGAQPAPPAGAPPAPQAGAPEAPQANQGDAPQAGTAGTNTEAALVQLFQRVFQQVLQNPAAGPPGRTTAAPTTASSVDLLTPYDGDELNMLDKIESLLFIKGEEPLSKTFSGQSSEVYDFVEALSHRAEKCRWDSEKHGILKIQKNGKTLNLLEDYGELDLKDVEAAREERENSGTKRAKQNAVMMHNCIYASISDEAKDIISAKQKLPRDGPSTFLRLMKGTFTATFTHAQSARLHLASLHPKRFNYKIDELNKHIKKKLSDLKTGSDGFSEGEGLSYIFEIYKRIKAPEEWVTEVLSLQREASRDPKFTTSQLLNEGLKKYNELKDGLNWKPSEKSIREMNEQVVALLAQKSNNQQGNNKGKGSQEKGKQQNAAGSGNPENTTEKQKQQPPFKDAKGKKGDTKKWKGKTYHYCPADHKNGHWVQHNPDNCQLAKKQAEQKKNPDNQTNKPNGAKVQVDAEQLKRAFIAVNGEESEETVSNKIEALLAVLRN
jgi:hypothetical protein